MITKTGTVVKQEHGKCIEQAHWMSIDDLARGREHVRGLETNTNVLKSIMEKGRGVTKWFDGIRSYYKYEGTTENTMITMSMVTTMVS